MSGPLPHRVDEAWHEAIRERVVEVLAGVGAPSREFLDGFTALVQGILHADEVCGRDQPTERDEDVA